MNNLDEGKQISVALWADHIKKALEALVPGTWTEATTGDNQSIRKSVISFYGRDLQIKNGYFYTYVIRYMRPATSGKADYAREMDSEIGSMQVNFECRVLGNTSRLPLGHSSEIGYNTDLDTPYEVADFVRTCIQNYRPGGGGNDDEPEFDPTPTPGEQVPTSVPVLSASAVNSAISMLLNEIEYYDIGHFEDGLVNFWIHDGHKIFDLNADTGYSHHQLFDGKDYVAWGRVDVKRKLGSMTWLGDEHDLHIDRIIDDVVSLFVGIKFLLFPPYSGAKAMSVSDFYKTFEGY